MLIARGHTHLGQADLRWALFFAPRLWAIVVDRHGLVLDTRFAPAAANDPRSGACLYLLLQGSWTLHGPTGGGFEAPSAFVLSEEQLEGARGARPFTFTARGTPYSAIEIHLHATDLLVTPGAAPVPVVLEPRVLQAARDAARISERDDDAFQRALVALIERVVEQGIFTPAVAERARSRPSKTFDVLWAGLRPMIERLYLNPTLKEVGDATGVSTRQVDRYVDSFVSAFRLFGRGWRPVTRHLRLKLAVILLSADGASVAEVASAVGYGSYDAMSRAFRDAGLPAPAALQQQLRAAR